MKIGIITDPGGVARWQAEALRQIAADNEFLIYECTNSRSKRRPLAHGLYFLLNLLAVRNAMTAGAPLPRELRIAGRTVFSAETDGAWQRLPRSLLDHIAADGPQLIIKFGMGLLRIPPADQLACPILSFHHGDPRQFRGRPAGFYEILAEAPVIGQVVQILSNALDAGAVVAFAESKAHPYSWRQSLIDAYRVSPALLPLAIRNATNGITLPIARNGPNRRLPDNATAARFVMKIGAAKLRRLAYGGLVEKGWEVAEADLPSDWSPDRLASLLEAAQWRTLPRPRRYRFFADPFFHPSGEGAILEAMRPTGEAEIVHVHRNECAKLAIAGRHCSYPATFQFAGRDLLLPEVSDWSAPRLFELTDAGVTDCGELDLPGKPLLLDATIEVHHGACYLFGNRRDEGDRILRLWVTDSPFGAFTEHPASPIRISPAGARMAGRILHSGGRLYRPGQDLRRAYGDGLLLFAIEEFSTIAYRESEATPLRFTGHRGPHTLNIRGNKALFDYYDDRFSLLAGLRRLRQSRAG